MKKTRLVSMLLIVSNIVLGQSLPTIFQNTPRQIVRAKIFVSYPKSTWLENLVIGENAALYITNYPEGKILKVSRDGSKELYASVDGKIAGITRYHRDQFLVSGWDKQNRASIFRIDEKRKVTRLLNIAGGMFPNGILHFYGDKYLIADSYAGCIWLYDAAINKVTVWLKDELLERSSEKARVPAANGLKMYKNNLYVSNTERQILIRIPVAGSKPGVPFLFMDKVNIDDFAFDNAGNIYAATNVYNSVVKITPQKEVTIVADLSTGVAGSTAVVFKKNEMGKDVLFVSTSGGMGMPPPAGVEEGKIVELFLD